MESIVKWLDKQNEDIRILGISEIERYLQGIASVRLTQIIDDDDCLAFIRRIYHTKTVNPIAVYQKSIRNIESLDKADSYIDDIPSIIQQDVTQTRAIFRIAINTLVAEIGKEKVKLLLYKGYTQKNRQTGKRDKIKIESIAKSFELY